MPPAVVHVHPEGTELSETKVVFAGIASVNVAVEQLLGPELVTTAVSVMLLPAETGLGVPALVTDRSQAVATGVATVVLLLAELGSLVEAETEELAVTVVAATVAATFTTTMICDDALAARVVAVQVTLPVAPTAGVVQDQPAGTEIEANVVLVGTACTKLTADADPGPLFVTVCS
jgi:hypothetical protein